MQSISLVGKLKTGKSTFALSAPSPLVYFDFEMGTSRVEPRYLPDMTNVKILSYVHQSIAIKGKKTETAIAFWDRILAEYAAALGDPAVKTIAFDTFTSVWEARRMAMLATLQQVDPKRSNLMPQEYSIPNADMKTLLVQARIHGKNLVLVHHTRDEYGADGKPTGEEVADGFKYTGDLTDIELWMTKKTNSSGKTVPYGTIKYCGLSMAAEGLEIESPTYKMIDSIVEGYRKIS